MLMPKRVKRRRVMRGRMKGKASRGNFVAYGEYGLQATETSGSWPVFAAASLLVSLPVLVIFLLCQKYMTSGLTAGGVKG